MNKYVAFCGLDCEKCEARIATINNDDALRKKVAELWSRLNGVEITAEMINCNGCRCDGVKTPFCQNLCQIRKCAVAKGFQTCGDCGDLEVCKTVATVVGNNDAALNNLKKIR